MKSNLRLFYRHTLHVSLATKGLTHTWQTNKNFLPYCDINVFHLLHLFSEHQQMTFNVQAVIKIESWRRERISGRWPGYVNFTTVIFRGFN